MPEQDIRVYVELYRGTGNDARNLERFLKDFEVVSHVSPVMRKGAGNIETGHLFFVYVLKPIVTYASGQIIKMISERVNEWYKQRGKKEQFITLRLSTQRKKTKIGKGKPRRLRWDE